MADSMGKRGLSPITPVGSTAYLPDGLFIQMRLKQGLVVCLPFGSIQPQSQVLVMWGNEIAGLAQRVGVVARPAVVLRLVDHAGADGVEFDVAVAGKDVVFGLCEAGAEAAFPQRAATLVGAVDILDVTLSEVFHQQGCAVWILWGEQQVDVVGHQHVSVNNAVELVGKFLQVMQVELVILFGMKAD